MPGSDVRTGRRWKYPLHVENELSAIGVALWGLSVDLTLPEKWHCVAFHTHGGFNVPSCFVAGAFITQRA